MSDSEINVKIGGDSSDAQRAITQAKDALKDGVSQMKGHISGLSDAFSAFKGVFLGFAAVLAGGKIFKEAIDETVKFASECASLSQRLGITTEEAGKLTIGMKLIGSSADVYTSAAMKLDRQLRTNEQGLKAMGVSTRDTSGQLKGQADIMDSALASLQQYKAGTDRNMASMVMFGRGAAEMSTLLKYNNEIKGEATRLQDAWNMKVGAEGVAQTRAYKMAVAEVGLAYSAIMDAVGKDVLPLFVELGQWFKGEGVDAVSGIIKVIEELGSTFKITGGIISDFWGFCENVFNQVKNATNDAFGEVGQKPLNVFTALIRVLNATLIVFKTSLSQIFLAIEGILEASVQSFKNWYQTGAAVFRYFNDAVTGLSNIFSESFKVIADILEQSVQKIKHWSDIATAFFHRDWAALKTEWQNGANSVFRVDLSGVKNAATNSKKILSLDWGGIGDTWKKGTSKTEQIIGKSLDNIKKEAADAAKAIDKVLSGEGGETKSGTTTPNKGNKTFVDPGTGKGKEEKDTRLQEWKNELEQMKEAEKAYFKDSKASDEQYWIAKLALVQGGGAKEAALRRQIEHELFNIHKQMAQEQRALDDEADAAKKAAGQNLLDIKKAQLQQELAMGRINEGQEIAGEQSILQQKYQIDLQELDSKLQRYADDKLAYAKLQEDKLALTRKYLADTQQLTDKMAIDNKKAIESMLSGITSAFGSAITGLIQKTTTFKQAFQQIMSSILSTFIGAIMKMVGEWAAGELAKTALAQKGSLFRTMLEKVGLIETAATTVTTNATKEASTVATAGVELTAIAPVAAGKAADSVADVEFVGPMLAAAAFAATLGMILGSRGHAVGSWNVPGDMFTKIHKGEMIVPEQFASSVRDGGGLGGGGDVHLHVNAVDSDSVKRLFRDNAAALSEVLRRQVRNFAPVRA